MRRLFAALDRRGESVYAYSGRTHTPYSTLIYWRRRLRNKSETPRFVELKPQAILGASSASLSLEVVLGNGHVLRIPCDLEERALRRVFAALEGQC